MLDLVKDSLLVCASSSAAVRSSRRIGRTMMASRAVDVVPLSWVLRSTGLVAQSSGIVIAAVSTNCVLCLVDDRARVVARV